MYGRKHSEETKEKIREKAKNRKGERSGMYGKHHTDETKDYLKKLYGKKVKINNIIYYSIREAAKEMNVDPSTIRYWVKKGKAEYII